MTNILDHQLLSVIVNKIVYVTQKNEFVTEMIVNVVIPTRLDKNVSKILFLNINISNFLLVENVNIFLPQENVNNFLLDLNVCIFYWTKNVNKLQLWDEKCQ